MYIPLQLVETEYFQELEVAIAAAVASSSSCKKPKISSSPSSSTPPCHLPVPSYTLSDGTTQNSFGYRCNAHKDEACASFRPLEETIAAHAAEDHEKLHGNAYNVEAHEAGDHEKVHGNACKTESLVSSRFLETIAADDAGYHEKLSAKDASCDRLNQCKDHEKLSAKDASCDHLNQCKDHACSRVLNGSKEQVRFANSCKQEAHDESNPHENSMSLVLADNTQTSTLGNERQPSSNLKETKAPIVDNNKPWMLASCFYKVKEGKLPHFQFKGRIEYSNTPLDAENAAHKLLRQIEAKKAACGGSVPLGFDAEWKVIDDQAQKVAVLQLCIDSGNCNVFHVIYSGISFPLRNILEDPSVFKVGVGSHADARKIFRAYNVAVNGVKDLNELANLKLKGPGQVNRPWSLSSLAEELFGKQVDKDKSIRMGDWELHNLSEAQLQYAATDAFASLSVFQALLDL